jgi:hypothetical protein
MVQGNIDYSMFIPPYETSTKRVAQQAFAGCGHRALQRRLDDAKQHPDQVHAVTACA